MSKPIILSRETEVAAIDRVVANERKRGLLYQMVDAVLRVKEAGTVGDADLGPIKVGFLESDEVVWGRAASWLAKLIKISPRAWSAVEELATHSKVQVRFNICASLSDERFPYEGSVSLLRSLLRDASFKVREKAVEVCGGRGLRELVPELQAMAGTEPDESKREALLMAVAFARGEAFRKGSYSVRRLQDGRIVGSPNR